MLPTWVPEVTFGNAITLMVGVFAYLSLRFGVQRNERLLRINNDLATLAAGHAKLSFDTSTTNAASIRTGTASTATEIKNAVASINSAAVEAAAIHTPVATKLPAELRVTIAKELAGPRAVEDK